MKTYEEFQKYCQMNFQILFMGCILTIDYIEKGNSEVPEESIEEYLVSDHHSSVLSPEDSPIQTSKSKYSILSSLLCVKCVKLLNVNNQKHSQYIVHILQITRDVVKKLNISFFAYKC